MVVNSEGSEYMHTKAIVVSLHHEQHDLHACLCMSMHVDRLYMHTYNIVVVIGLYVMDYLNEVRLAKWTARGDLRPLENARKTEGI